MLCIHEPDRFEVHLLFQESFIKLFELVPIKEKIDWMVVVDLRAEVLLRRLNVPHENIKGNIKVRNKEI